MLICPLNPFPPKAKSSLQLPNLSPSHLSRLSDIARISQLFQVSSIGFSANPTHFTPIPQHVNDRAAVMHLYAIKVNLELNSYTYMAHLGAPWPLEVRTSCVMPRQWRNMFMLFSLLTWITALEGRGNELGCIRCKTKSNPRLLEVKFQTWDSLIPELNWLLSKIGFIL